MSKKKAAITSITALAAVYAVTFAFLIVTMFTLINLANNHVSWTIRIITILASTSVLAVAGYVIGKMEKVAFKSWIEWLKVRKTSE